MTGKCSGSFLNLMLTCCFPGGGGGVWAVGNKILMVVEMLQLGYKFFDGHPGIFDKTTQCPSFVEHIETAFNGFLNIGYSFFNGFSLGMTTR